MGILDEDLIPLHLGYLLVICLSLVFIFSCS